MRRSSTRRSTSPWTIPAFAALHGDIGADVGGREVAAEILEIEAGRHAERGAHREVERKADGHERRCHRQLARTAEGEKRRLRLDLQERDAAADIGDQALRGMARIPDDGDDVTALPAHAVA